MSSSGNSKTKEEEFEDVKLAIYDIIKGIQDPEKPSSLEELGVVTEECVEVTDLPEGSKGYQVVVKFIPTVPHCSLATLIGLSLRAKLQRDFPEKVKLQILIKEGSHSSAQEINKQLNDKERVAAALENPSLRDLVTQCIEAEE